MIIVCIRGTQPALILAAIASAAAIGVAQQYPVAPIGSLPGRMA
jgi:hypothetical protein